MASVVTVGTCSAKSPYCQNALRRCDCVGHKSNSVAAGDMENCAPSHSVIGEKKLAHRVVRAQYAKYRWLAMNAKKTVNRSRDDVPTLALPDSHAGGTKAGCQSNCDW